MRQRDMRQWLRGAAVLGSLVLTLLATGAAASSVAPTAAPTTSPASTDMETMVTDQLTFTIEGAQDVVIAAAVDCAALEVDIFVFYNDYLYPDVAIFLEFQTCQVDVDTTTGTTTVIIIFDVQAPSGTQPATMAEIDGAYAAYVQANPTGQLAVLGPPEISRVTRDGPQAPPTASPTKAPTTADEALLPPEIGCCPNLRRWQGECTTDSPSACWSAKGSGGVPGVCGATKGGWFATECVFGTTWDNAAAMCASVNAALCSAAELPNALTDTGCDFSHTPVWTRDRWNLQTGECRDLEQVALDSTTGEYKCSHRSNLKAVACCAPETCPTQAPTTSPTVSPTAAPTKLTRCCEEIVEDVSIVGASGNWSDPSTNDLGVCISRAGGWTPGVCAKTTYNNAELLCESVGAELCTPSEFALGAALPPEMGGCDPHDAYWLRGDPFRETCRPGEQQVALGDGTDATKCAMATSIKGVQCCAYSCTPPPALVPTAAPSQRPTTSPTTSDGYSPGKVKLNVDSGLGNGSGGSGQGNVLGAGTSASLAVDVITAGNHSVVNVNSQNGNGNGAKGGGDSGNQNGNIAAGAEIDVSVSSTHTGNETCTCGGQPDIVAKFASSNGNYNGVSNSAGAGANGRENGNLGGSTEVNVDISCPCAQGSGGGSSTAVLNVNSMNGNSNGQGRSGSGAGSGNNNGNIGDGATSVAVNLTHVECDGDTKCRDGGALGSKLKVQVNSNNGNGNGVNPFGSGGGGGGSGDNDNDNNGNNNGNNNVGDNNGNVNGAYNSGNWNGNRNGNNNEGDNNGNANGIFNDSNNNGVGNGNGGGTVSVTVNGDVVQP